MKLEKKNCQVLDEQVGFEVRWAIAGTSIVTQVIISWPEEHGDDRNNDADHANMATRLKLLQWLTVGGPAERGSVHGIWSLWRRRSVKVCTAFHFTFSFPQSCDWFCKILFLVFSRMVGGDVTVAWMDHKYCIFNLQQYCHHLKENDDDDDDVN